MFFFTLSLRLWWIFTLMEQLTLNQLHFKCSVAILDSGRRDLGLNEHFGAHEKHWAEKQLSSKQNVWEEQRDTNTPESSNFLPGATDCDTKSFGCLRQVFFGTKLFNFPPEPLILIHQSPNLQRSRMAVHKSFYEKMEHFHHPQRTSIGSLPLLTHPSNMARMTLMSEPGDMNRLPHKRVSLRCRHKDRHTHTHIPPTQSRHPYREKTLMHEIYPLLMFTKLTKTLRVCSCLKFSTNFQIDLGTDRSTICRKMF